MNEFYWGWVVYILQERKKMVKEVQREKRKNKIFKYVKKRKEKIVKVKKGKQNGVIFWLYFNFEIEVVGGGFFIVLLLEEVGVWLCDCFKGLFFWDLVLVLFLTDLLRYYFNEEFCIFYFYIFIL